ncbi:LOW QUALITY PROTEIN: tetratricopeptide repeat protein SKI3-like [Asparagus officinalis]|uniref:LOW QUALITY PROTEIN: tetratricopeptide repeat protein SKI3-like n=1 Tax=Asparagus officinalis TaxID=4686 RepID=UPI00098DE3AA|nr:LOW QUALITY PROTEIN: tetratricopeptide repeat protein SKI3-like [Asparagus officinalis]
MFTAAIKSYGRAIELEDSKVFSLIESGNILLMLGSFRKGIEQFRSALKIAPQNASAHFGLASGLLGLSKECASSGAFGWGASLLEEASEVVKAGTHLCGNVYSAWKLHGDIQSAYAKCFPWDDKRTCDEINEGSFKISINNWKKTCLFAANDAKRSYQRALHLAPWHANIYTDVAITLDLIDSSEEKETPETDVWQIPERMSMGSLLLEGVNCESWVILSCLSKDPALKQHALIRGLQLDASLSIAWAYLGKMYRNLGERQLAGQAFDRARSIDPSLALPWAGMSADFHEGTLSTSEAYESCLRAAQILPVAEFQMGLGKLAVLSGHLLSPQVFGAIRQAVQRAPCCPESHNLNGLVCEARSDYQSAIAAYRLAQCALKIGCYSKDVLRCHQADVSINLARALCQADYAMDAARECEHLEKDDLLDSSALQIYAVALWKLGNRDLAFTLAKKMAKIVSTMKPRCAVAALGLVCSLVYCISGLNPSATFLQKIPTEFLHSTKMSFIVATINALDQSSRLEMLLQSSLQTFASHESVAELHSIICMSKIQMGHGSEQNLEIHRGVDYLKKVLHMYPDSNLIRNYLSSLLLSTGDWMASHKATECTVIPSGYPVKTGLKSPFEINGIAGVACYSSCVTSPKLSFPTCKDQLMFGSLRVHQLQKWLHQEPWSGEAHYLLLLNVLQKAREEKFPQNLCVTLKRLVSVAISRDTCNDNDLCKHLKFLTLLSASELSLQCGDYLGCGSLADNALEVLPPHGDPFFAHLQLCRAYVAQGDMEKVKDEYLNCLRVKTAHPIGWIILKYFESKFKLQKDSNMIDINFRSNLYGSQCSRNMWTAIFNLVSGQSYIWDQDFHSAEKALALACSFRDVDSCLLLCHGAICMELARQRAGSEFLQHAVTSLKKAQETSPFPLPIVSALLAQAEASLGARAKWEKNLRFEWFSWPPEMRPAELYFQMHLLSNSGPKQQHNIELSQSPRTWILRAIHLNPSCSRYWKVLEKIES